MKAKMMKTLKMKKKVKTNPNKQILRLKNSYSIEEKIN
jgi:hypothetical protein